MRTPEARTNPARSRLVSANDTVGFDRPVSRASSARESCAAARIWSSSSCSLSARISCGPAGLAVAAGVVTRDPVSLGLVDAMFGQVLLGARLIV